MLRAMSCTEIATAHTMAFLARHLPPAPARILEVGCGRGEVAAALGGLGHEVDAIDVDADAVAAARALGVPARQADFFSIRAGAHDVVLLTRSLHHIAPLQRALDHASGLMAPGGSIVIEDFAVEAMDAVTATWFYDLCALLGVAGALWPAQDMAADPLAAWVAEHEHHPGEEPLHTGAAMQDALAARFAVVATEPAPYLYRTIVRRTDDRALTSAFLTIEEQRIAAGHLRAIGLRMVARSQAAR